MKTRTKVITAVIGIAAVAALVLPRVLKPEEKPEAAAVPVVKAESPTTGSIYLESGLIGTVEPNDVVYIIPKLAGEVMEVFVQAGDMVTEGQPICRIDNKQIESAKITMDTASVQAADANTNLQRMQVLYASGDISAQAFEQAKSGATAANLQYQAAKLNYDTQVEFSTITSPIAGKVESLGVEVHNMVSQQSSVAVIAGEGVKTVSFSVTERLSKNLKVGDSLTVEKHGTQYEATVTEVGTMVNAQTGMFPVKAALNGGDGLATGVAVKLYVTSDKAENVMTIPVDSVYYDGGDAYVYTYDNGTVHKVPVEVGIYDSETIHVISGITEADRVITTWSSELREGAQVQEMDAQ